MTNSQAPDREPTGTESPHTTTEYPGLDRQNLPRVLVVASALVFLYTVTASMFILQ